MVRNGYNTEREIVKKLEQKGYKAIRTPHSGAGTNRDLPDIIAGNGRGKYYAIEVKSSRKDYIYIQKEQLLELERFALGFGATPIIIARFTYQPPFIIPYTKLPRTRSGKGKIKRDNIKQYKTI